LLPGLEGVRYRNVITFHLKEGRKGASKRRIVVHDQELKPALSHGHSPLRKRQCKQSLQVLASAYLLFPSAGRFFILQNQERVPGAGPAGERHG